MDTQKKLINNFKKICICRGVTAATILTAIQNGALSFEALRRKIGTGTGNCRAKRCRAKIEQMVRDHKASLKDSPDPEVSLKTK